jgi:hypothetical protein
MLRASSPLRRMVLSFAEPHTQSVLGDDATAITPERADVVLRSPRTSRQALNGGHRFGRSFIV